MPLCIKHEIKIHLTCTIETGTNLSRANKLLVAPEKKNVYYTLHCINNTTFLLYTHAVYAYYVTEIFHNHMKFQCILDLQVNSIRHKMKLLAQQRLTF